MDQAQPSPVPVGQVERLDAEDAARLVRERHAAAGVVALPPADMRKALRRLEARLAFAETSEGDEVAQRVAEPMSDVLEKALLLLSPGTRPRALVQAEEIRPVAFRAQRHEHLRAHAEVRRDVGLDRALVPRSGGQRPAGIERGARHLGRIGRHRQIAPASRGARELRPRMLHDGPPRRRIRVAGIEEPGPVGVENLEHRIQHLAHHAFQVVGSLHGTVDAVHRLEEPKVRVVLGNVDVGADELDELTRAIEHGMGRGADMSDCAVRLHGPVFHIQLRAFAQRPLEALRPRCSVLRVDRLPHRVERRKIRRRFGSPQRQPTPGPMYEGVASRVPRPARRAAKALCRGQVRVAPLQIRQGGELDQCIAKPAPDLLEQPHLVRGPDARIGALIDTEIVEVVVLPALLLRLDRYRKHRLRTEVRMHPGNVRRHGSEHKRHRPRGRADFHAHGVGILVGDVLDAYPVAVVVARTQLYRQALVPGSSGASAENTEYHALALEDVEDLAEHVVHHLLEVVRALHRAMDPVHRLEEPHVRAALRFGDLALGDVPPDAAVAGEAARLVEHRDAGNGHVAPATVGRGAGDLEVAERQVRIERRPVLAPRLFVRFDVRHLPARLADFGAPRRRVGDVVGEILPREAMLGVGLPVHIEGELHQRAKALLARLQRLLQALALADVPGVRLLRPPLLVMAPPQHDRETVHLLPWPIFARFRAAVCPRASRKSRRNGTALARATACKQRVSSYPAVPAS